MLALDRSLPVRHRPVWTRLSSPTTNRSSVPGCLVTALIGAPGGKEPPIAVQSSSAPPGLHRFVHTRPSPPAANRWSSPCAPATAVTGAPGGKEPPAAIQLLLTPVHPASALHE